MLFLVKHLKKSVTKSDEKSESIWTQLLPQETENNLNKKYFQ